MAALKEYQAKYKDLESSHDLMSQENKLLKDQIDDLRQELYQTVN
jgi:prefoldin subunit 5